MKSTLSYVIVSILMIVLNSQAVIASDLTELETKANQGDAEAMFDLGEMYENGVGVIQNYVEAHKWYNISASRGYVKARKARDAIAKKMIAEKIDKAQELAIKWKPFKGTDAISKAGGKKLSPLEELFKATSGGDVEKVKEILNSGTDPNTEIAEGVPLLIVAVHENQMPVVKALVEAGADVKLL